MVGCSVVLRFGPACRTTAGFGGAASSDPVTRTRGRIEVRDGQDDQIIANGGGLLYGAEKNDGDDGTAADVGRKRKGRLWRCVLYIEQIRRSCRGRVAGRREGACGRGAAQQLKCYITMLQVPSTNANNATGC